MKKIFITTSVLILLVFFIVILNYYILKNTYELHQHNMNGASGNVVYLNNDGQQEVVYDKDGVLVTDPANAGSYNYCNPIEKPYCHFKLDTKLWIEFGNGTDDPTTKKERRNAFLKDYFDGFKRLVGLME